MTAVVEILSSAQSRVLKIQDVIGAAVQLLNYNTILYNTTTFNSDANCKLKRESTLSLTRWPADAMQSKAHHNTMK